MRPDIREQTSRNFAKTSRVEQPYQPYILEGNLAPLQKLSLGKGCPIGYQTSQELRQNFACGEQPSTLTTFTNLTNA